MHLHLRSIGDLKQISSSGKGICYFAFRLKVFSEPAMISGERRLEIHGESANLGSMMRRTPGNKNQLISLAVGLLSLSGCGGSSSETPMPLEPVPHKAGPRDQPDVVTTDDQPTTPPETETTGAVESDAPATN